MSNQPSLPIDSDVQPVHFHTLVYRSPQVRYQIQQICTSGVWTYEKSLCVALVVLIRGVDAHMDLGNGCASDGAITPFSEWGII